MRRRIAAGIPSALVARSAPRAEALYQNQVLIAHAEIIAGSMLFGYRHVFTPIVNPRRKSSTHLSGTTPRRPPVARSHAQTLSVFAPLAVTLAPLRETGHKPAKSPSHPLTHHPSTTYSLPPSPIRLNPEPADATVSLKGRPASRTHFGFIRSESVIQWQQRHKSPQIAAMRRNLPVPKPRKARLHPA